MDPAGTTELKAGCHNSGNGKIDDILLYLRKCAESIRRISVSHLLFMVHFKNEIIPVYNLTQRHRAAQATKSLREVPLLSNGTTKFRF
jgi:hypothetical protein